MSSKTLVFVSSGDVVADRRYEYGVMLREAGDEAAAADLFAQALEIAPDWAAGWFALGEARVAAGDRAGAAEAFRQVLRLDPADRFGAMLKLALIGEVATPDVAPPAYVRDLFDQYAARFDVALVERLNYSVPWTIAERLETLVPAETRHPLRRRSISLRHRPCRRGACAAGSAGFPASTCHRQ
ncbi:MAG: tetratricopeptide repeat protein [Hyphomicrobiales bacterium]